MMMMVQREGGSPLRGGSQLRETDTKYQLIETQGTMKSLELSCQQ